MGNKKISRLIFTFITAAVLIAVICLIHYHPQRPADDTGIFTITNLDVGKADAAVIRYKGKSCIIDTGTYDSYEEITSYLKKNGISKIDYMILTHYDKDHIGSAVRLMDNYPVDTVYLPDYESDKDLYPPLMEYISQKDNTVFINETTAFDIADAKAELLPAKDPAELLADDKNYDNDMSLVCMISLEGFRFLFTGDIENARMKQMLDSSYDLSCDWIKIPHHGKYDKKIKAILKKASPEYAVLSTSYDEPPEDKLIEALNDNSIQTFCTMNGSVTTTCDGREIKISQ